MKPLANFPDKQTARAAQSTLDGANIPSTLVENTIFVTNLQRRKAKKILRSLATQEYFLPQKASILKRLAQLLFMKH